MGMSTIKWIALHRSIGLGESDLKQYTNFVSYERKGSKFCLKYDKITQNW